MAESQILKSIAEKEPNINKSQITLKVLLKYQVPGYIGIWSFDEYSKEDLLFLLNEAKRGNLEEDLYNKKIGYDNVGIFWQTKKKADKDEVFSPLLSLHAIVVAGNPAEIYSFYVSFSWSVNYSWFPFYRSHIIVVTMLMAYYYDICALLYPFIIDPASHGVRVSDYLQARI